VRLPRRLPRNNVASMRASETAPDGSCRIRRALADDVLAVAHIWHIGWGDGHIGHVPPELVQYRHAEQFVTRTAQRLDTLWVAETDSAIVGFFVLKHDEVEQLYVDRPARGTGIAERLLHAAEMQILHAGYRRAWLAVVPGNARARAFYARLDWRDMGPLPYSVETEAGPLEIQVHRYERDL
jgi:GNAT superfamily N-acetyltransferase